MFSDDEIKNLFQLDLGGEELITSFQCLVGDDFVDFRIETDRHRDLSFLSDCGNKIYTNKFKPPRSSSGLNVSN